MITMPMMIRFHRPRVRFRRTDPAGEELATAVEFSLLMMEPQSQTAMNYLRGISLKRHGSTTDRPQASPRRLRHGLGTLAEADTPPELRFAFSQLLELFQGQSVRAEVITEMFWASLHGTAELTRTKRFPRSRQKERLRTLVELFTFPG